MLINLCSIFFLRLNTVLVDNLINAHHLDFCNNLSTMIEAKKRKQRYSASISAARAAKQRKLQVDSNAMSASSSVDVPLNESLVLPRVEPEIDEQVDSEDEEFSESNAQEFYKEWIECQPKYTIKMMAVVL